MKLPPHFYEPNEFGICGLTEIAFLSTTSEKNVALMYSGVKDDLPFPEVFEITVGAVDRGACIQEFSQYPGEVKCLHSNITYVCDLFSYFSLL